jgi:hypothetical protein
MASLRHLLAAARGRPLGGHQHRALAVRAVADSWSVLLLLRGLPSRSTRAAKISVVIAEAGLPIQPAVGRRERET